MEFGSEYKLGLQGLVRKVIVANYIVTALDYDILGSDSFILCTFMETVELMLISKF